MTIEAIQANKALFEGLCDLIPSLRSRSIVKLCLRLDIESIPTLELTERVLPCHVATSSTRVAAGETATTRVALVTLKEGEPKNGR